MPNRIALIDADTVLYMTALGGEQCAPKQGDDGEDLWFPIYDAERAYEIVCDKFEALIRDVGAETAILALTTSRCFRYDLLSTYKAQRKASRRPALLLELQAMVTERRPWGVLAVRGLEADDVCGISMGHLQRAGKREPVVVSVDKDLHCIPGLHYSPLKSSDGVIEVTPPEADRFHLYQTLVGDVADNYAGCPGIGPKKAAKLLDACAHASPAAQWAWVEEAFRKKGVSAADALIQARVARILRDEDWDQAKEEIRLWNPSGDTPEIFPLDTLASIN